MKKKLSLIPLFILPLLFVSTGCTETTNSNHVLRILNWEDYIYEDEEEDMISLFQDAYEEEHGYRPSVIYDTFDTNESMLNELKTGKVRYDLIVPSDYMVQKLIAEDLIQPFDDERLGEEFDAVSNYTNYASHYLMDAFKEVPIRIKSGSEYEGLGLTLHNYCKGYMWGTLGMIFNPEFRGFNNLPNNEDGERIFEDFRMWNVFWDTDYRGTFSIKDSMRDSYAVSILDVFEEELLTLLDDFNNGTIDAIEYNHGITEIFNRNDDSTIALVESSLNALSANAFGFEVDSGKEDIQVGKIGANAAWSGDAVYAMDNAEGRSQNPIELYYSVPETGVNFWFDGWVMPKGANKDLAQAFVDFISVPENAALNMGYIGYTPCIAGDEILETVREWYDYRDIIAIDEGAAWEEEILDENGVGTGEFELVWETSRNDFYNSLDLEDPEIRRNYESDDVRLERVDLDYFFNGTFTEIFDENGNPVLDDLGNQIFTHNDSSVAALNPELLQDTIFWSDCYLPFSEQTQDPVTMEWSREGNVAVGRQFFCQFPDGETMIRGAVMKDFGDQHGAILRMWERVRATLLPVWAIVLLVAQVVIVIILILYFALQKNLKKKLRKQRKEAK